MLCKGKAKEMFVECNSCWLHCKGITRKAIDFTERCPNLGLRVYCMGCRNENCLSEDLGGALAMHTDNDI